jgi:hypothetical protein
MSPLQTTKQQRVYRVYKLASMSYGLQKGPAQQQQA